MRLLMLKPAFMRIQARPRRNIRSTCDWCFVADAAVEIPVALTADYSENEVNCVRLEAFAGSVTSCHVLRYKKVEDFGRILDPKSGPPPPPSNQPKFSITHAIPPAPRSRLCRILSLILQAMRMLRLQLQRTTYTARLGIPSRKNQAYSRTWVSGRVFAPSGLPYMWSQFGGADLDRI